MPLEFQSKRGEPVLPSYLLASLVAAAAVSPTTVASADSISVGRAANGEFMTKYYPYEAMKRGEQGKVSFELTVEPDGSLASCTVTGSSGFATLDRETCEFLSKYAKVQPANDADGRPVRAVQQGYIQWRLPKRAAHPQAKSPTPASAGKLPTDRFGKALDMNKVICRRYARTGSKVGTIKQCMTRQDWAMKDDNARDEVRRLQENSGLCGDPNDQARC